MTRYFWFGWLVFLGLCLAFGCDSDCHGQQCFGGRCGAGAGGTSWFGGLWGSRSVSRSYSYAPTRYVQSQDFGDYYGDDSPEPSCSNSSGRSYGVDTGSMRSVIRRPVQAVPTPEQDAPEVKEGRIILKCPANALVTINGKQVDQQGKAARIYHAPLKPIPAGYCYRFEVQSQYGAATVRLHPGETRTVTITPEQVAVR